jgi:hypothetical protein
VADLGSTIAAAADLFNGATRAYLMGQLVGVADNRAACEAIAQRVADREGLRWFLLVPQERERRVAAVASTVRELVIALTPVQVQQILTR